MKEYQAYMNTISVDPVLHHRIIKQAATKSSRQKTIRYSLAAVISCAALLLVSLWNPTLWQKQPDQMILTDLTFNRGELGAADNRKQFPPGYFTEKLTAETLQSVLGDAATLGSWDVQAGFSGEGNTIDLYASLLFSSGTAATIQMANGPVLIDYRFPNEPTITTVHGTEVVAGYWQDDPSSAQFLYYASFQIGATGYYMEITGKEEVKDELTLLVNTLILQGAVDLTVITPSNIPEWREETLSWEQAGKEMALGSYVPAQTIDNLGFDFARRTINQQQNDLSLHYYHGMHSLNWRIHYLNEENKKRIVAIAQTETYDLSLYPIPRADSIPDELRLIVEDPIFRVEDLTLETVLTRAYKMQDAGDTSEYRMHFSVLYGTILVGIDAKGVQPETIYALLRDLPITK